MTPPLFALLPPLPQMRPLAGRPSCLPSPPWPWRTLGNGPSLRSQLPPSTRLSPPFWARCRPLQLNSTPLTPGSPRSRPSLNLSGDTRILFSTASTRDTPTTPSPPTPTWTPTTLISNTTPPNTRPSLMRTPPSINFTAPFKTPVPSAAPPPTPTTTTSPQSSAPSSERKAGFSPPLFLTTPSRRSPALGTDTSPKTMRHNKPPLWHLLSSASPTSPPPPNAPAPSPPLPTTTS